TDPVSRCTAAGHLRTYARTNRAYVFIKHAASPSRTGDQHPYQHAHQLGFRGSACAYALVVALRRTQATLERLVRFDHRALRLAENDGAREIKKKAVLDHARNVFERSPEILWR